MFECILTQLKFILFYSSFVSYSFNFYSILIIQDGSGGWTCSFPSATFKWAGGSAPTLTTTASAKDILVFRSDGSLMYEVGRQLNLS